MKSLHLAPGGFLPLPVRSFSFNAVPCQHLNKGLS
ncbi:hypothetical protein VPHK251G3_0043 [Vibrio phage K251 g3]